MLNEWQNCGWGACLDIFRTCFCVEVQTKICALPFLLPWTNFVMVSVGVNPLLTSIVPLASHARDLDSQVRFFKIFFWGQSYSSMLCNWFELPAGFSLQLPRVIRNGKSAACINTYWTWKLFFYFLKKFLRKARKRTSSIGAVSLKKQHLLSTIYIFKSSWLNFNSSVPLPKLVRDTKVISSTGNMRAPFDAILYLCPIQCANSA
mgnify:CR=1 FL=1